MKKMEPLLNRVVVRQVKMMPAGKLIIAESAQKSADRAEVLAVGPGMLDVTTGKHVPMGLKVGDIVLINRFLGMAATLENGDQVIIQKEDDILAREVEVGGEANG